MKKNIILLVVWLIAIFLIIFSIVKNPHSFLVNGTILVGWLLFAIQLTLNKSEKFYMWVKNIWFTIKNPDCIWNMQVEYYVEFNVGIFDKIDSVFLTKENNCRIITLSNQRKLYKVNTLTYEIVVSQDKIRLQLVDLEVSFRRSKNIIQKEIGTLLESLTKVIKEDKSDYYLTINFREYNPYFGFFVRRLNANEVNAFNVKFNVDDERVSINKNSIELHTGSLQSLRNFSEDYLSLSPR